MNITVFGGAGFLGSHLCEALSCAGHSVTVVDLHMSSWLCPNQRMLIGSIVDEDFVAEAVRGADAVFNYAGIAHIDTANNNPVESVRTNVLGNSIILEACRCAQVKRYVFASTLYVYGMSGGFYRCSKQACELYIENYKTMYDLAYTIVRYGSLYGPRADKHNAIYRFVCEALTGDSITYYGPPTALREYIHVHDAAVATVQLLNQSFANSNIIISGNQSMQIEDLFRMLEEMLGKKLSVNFDTDPHSGHYQITPYTFMPKVGKKLVLPLYIDLGQGLLQIMEEIHTNIITNTTSTVA